MGAAWARNPSNESCVNYGSYVNCGSYESYGNYDSNATGAGWTHCRVPQRPK